MIIVCIIKIKLYVLKPIQCTITESYSNALTKFEYYVDNMWWIENVFRLFTINVQSTVNETTYKNLDYYLWSNKRMLPFFILQQFFPHFFLIFN